MILGDAFGHVIDSRQFHLFETQGVGFTLPFGLSKFMVLELLACALICAIYIPLSKRVASGEPPRGVFWNSFEVLLTYIRNKVAIPYIGEHDADKYVPFLWTLFLFILFNNLLGMFPGFGSPTASFAVTLALAFVAFCMIHWSAIKKLGGGHYVMGYLPHIEAPMGMGPIIGWMIFSIEWFGNLIKAFVLAVRLFANMFAGHLVLAFILYFIVMAKNTGWFLFWPISFGSLFMVTGLSLLELFVAFLQAFVFTFLTALFLGSALHPHH